MMEEKKKCCGTCRYHEHENISDGWVCVNDESEYLADWTEYNDSCEEWTERESKSQEKAKKRR